MFTDHHGSIWKGQLTAGIIVSGLRFKWRRWMDPALFRAFCLVSMPWKTKEQLTRGTAMITAITANLHSRSLQYKEVSHLPKSSGKSLCFIKNRTTCKYWKANEKKMNEVAAFHSKQAFPVSQPIAHVAVWLYNRNRLAFLGVKSDCNASY